MEKQCQYAGCKKQASFILTQLVGKKQSLKACVDCVPEWVKNGKGSKFYKVVKI